MIVVVTAAWSCHLTAVGLSYATLAPPLLYLLLTGRDWSRIRWLWDTPYIPLAISVVIALTITFAIEICLGVSVVKYGPLYPSLRAKTIVERALLPALAWLYAVDPAEIVDAFLVVLGVLLAVVDHRMRSRPPLPSTVAPSTPPTDLPSAPITPNGGARRGSHILRVAEVIVGVLATLETLTFGNAAGIQAEGLNVFAALYAEEVDKLGDNQAAIDSYDAQIKNLEALHLSDHPPPEQTRRLLQAISKWTQSSVALDQANLEESAIEERPYQQRQIEFGPAETHELPEMKTPSHKGNPLRYIARDVTQFLTIQREATEASEISTQRQQDLAKLLDEAKIELSHVIGESGQSKGAEGRIDRAIPVIIKLIAAEGDDKVSSELRNQEGKLAKQLEEKQQFNAGKARYLALLRVFREQEHRCLETADRVTTFLATDTDGSAIVATLKSLDGRYAADNPPPRSFQPVSVTLLEWPNWRPEYEAFVNADLAELFERNLRKRLYGNSTLVEWVGRGGVNTLVRTNYQNLGGTWSSHGAELLENLVERACASNQTDQDVIEQLQQLRRTL